MKRTQRKLSQIKRYFLMLFWLLFSVPVVIIFLVLMINQANLLQSPGIMPRLKIFFTTNIAEISPEPVLPELTSPVYPLSQQQLYDTVINACESLQWTIAKKDPQQFRIDAVVTTSLWKFKDDIQLTILESETNSSSLHAVSRSRVGRGDLAANSHHLQQLLSVLESSNQSSNRLK